MFHPVLNKKQLVGVVLLLMFLAMYLLFTPSPRLNNPQGDLEVVTSSQAECFQGVCKESVASASTEESAQSVTTRVGPRPTDTVDEDSSEGVQMRELPTALEEPSRPFGASDSSEPVTSPDEVSPFTNIAMSALTDGFEVVNYRPGVVVFDYDRDGDMDFYITSEVGHSNFLYRNEGDGSFTNVATAAGVMAVRSNSSGAIACDLNNDGYQDLYVGARGVMGDELDFRSAGQDRAASKDTLFLNNRDGTFTDITASAIGDAVNLRSAGSIACADVDGDGWLDLYVGNVIDEDFWIFDQPSHPGHYNVLYRNNGDLTFQEIAELAGVRGLQIMMWDPLGQPLVFKDPTTGQEYEGYDPTVRDAEGNPVGDPTGRTHAVLFFDYDDDGDPDLWLANDGDQLHVFRNDSSPGNITFTPVTQAMGMNNRVGNWMGFAVGDYDGDVDLDVFVTNVGYHLRLGPPQEQPSGDCRYQGRFVWGTCLHFLLRNEGPRQVPTLGVVGVFQDVAPSTIVLPSPLMPPDSLDPTNIHPRWEVPTGLAAYDFGYGTTFFDFDNDGRQDLYWLGSEGPPGYSAYPAAGRMLQGDGQGVFEDITVRAHLLDILGVDYSILDRGHPGFNASAQRISNKFHQNGKGLAHGDLNGDGYVDLIGTNSSGPVWSEPSRAFIPAMGPVFVWLNGGGSNHWIVLRLKGSMAVDGTGSNADGIGARGYVKTAFSGGDKPLTQVQEVRAGSSYLSMDSIELEFGVGAATVVDKIIILWPSGRRQVLENVPINQVVVITEPER